VVRIPGNPIVDQLHTMKQRMEALYSKSFRAEAAGPDRVDAEANSDQWKPLVDIWESNREWLLIADLPGVAEEDLQVELVENELAIRGKRKTATVLDGMKGVQIERPEGRFSRSFVLPEDTCEEAIKAEFKHGVLTVSVLKDRGSQATSQKVRVRSD
jgi:HSP20 family protein